MLDINLIRNNPDVLRAAFKKRNATDITTELLEVDASRRSIMGELQSIQSERNALAKQLGQAKAKGEDASDLMAKTNSLKEQEKQLTETERTVSKKFMSFMNNIANIPAADVPDGADENDNIELLKWGTPQKFDFTPKAHYDLGENLGQLDFATGAKLAGARFAWLQGSLARLERALAQYFLNTLTAEGFTEVSPPYLVNDATVHGTGQLEKFEEDQFKTTDGRWLIPTSEVPLTNYAQDRIFKPEELPCRFTAFTPCFRKEAGSAGRDTRGLIRLHQFLKVEMVQLVHPDESEAAHEFMTTCAEKLLQGLELPYRKVILCGGDIGFGAIKTYDLEVWLPSQDTYREISSCSNCGDFQARRMKARFKDAETGKTRFIHTLNGSGLAVGRALVAVLENYQNADGSINIPSVLQPYMGGQTVITQ